MSTSSRIPLAQRRNYSNVQNTDHINRLKSKQIQNNVLQKVQPNTQKNSKNYATTLKNKRNGLRSRSSSRNREQNTLKAKNTLKNNISQKTQETQKKCNYITFEDPTLVPSHILKTHNIQPISYTAEQSHNMKSINDNYQYLRYKEQNNPKLINIISNTFLSDRNVFPTIKQRSLLFEWLANCNHQLCLKRITFDIGISILDRYTDYLTNPEKIQMLDQRIQNCDNLDKKSKQELFKIEDLQISKENYQLIGAASLALASKIEELVFPVMDDWVWLSDNAITRDEIIQMQKRIIWVLDWETYYPTQLEFLRRNSTFGQLTDLEYRLSSYLSEIGRYHPQFCINLPSKNAAACFLLARILSIYKATGIPAKTKLQLLETKTECEENKENLGGPLNQTTSSMKDISIFLDETYDKNATSSTKNKTHFVNPILWNINYIYHTGYDTCELIEPISILCQLLIEIRDIYQNSVDRYRNNEKANNNNNHNNSFSKHCGLAIFSKYSKKDSMEISKSHLIMTKDINSGRIVMSPIIDQFALGNFELS